MFATRCSDRIRVRDRRLAQLSRDITLTYTAPHRWSARRGQGRVVGLVTHDLPDAKQKASPCYRGVPAGEIRRALSDLGAGDLIRWKAGSFEDVVRRRHRTACTAVAFKFHVQSRLLEVPCSQ